MNNNLLNLTLFFTPQKPENISLVLCLYVYKYNGFDYYFDYYDQVKIVINKNTNEFTAFLSDLDGYEIVNVSMSYAYIEYSDWYNKYYLEYYASPFSSYIDDETDDSIDNEDNEDYEGSDTNKTISVSKNPQAKKYRYNNRLFFWSFSSYWSYYRYYYFD